MPRSEGCTLIACQVFAAESGSPYISSWVGLLVMMLAVALNESSVDSFQNAIVAAVSCHFFKSAKIKWIRTAMVLVNIPYIFIALQQLPVLQLFLIANMLNNLTFPPLVAGFYIGPYGEYMTDGMVSKKSVQCSPPCTICKLPC